MRAVATMMENHHKVQVLDEALEASVKLSHRYIPARQLPDKSVSLLDTACARVAISQFAVPAEVDDSRKRIAALETELKIIGKEKPIEGRPADLIKPQLKDLKKEAQRLGILKKEEDLITYALNPNVAPKFLRGELKEEALPAVKPDPAPVPAPSRTEFQVDVDGELFNVRIYPVSGTLSIKDISTIPAEKTSPKDQKGAVLSPMQGMVLRLLVKPGDKVEKGKPVAVLEAMKMEMSVESPHAGQVREIFVFESEMINAGDLLMIIH